jgi:hypothetical protein
MMGTAWMPSSHGMPALALIHLSPEQRRMGPRRGHKHIFRVAIFPR